MRKTAIVGLIAIAWISIPLKSGVLFAQTASEPAASSSAASQMADKDTAMKTLADAKKRFKFMRKKSSQDPHAQADLDRQITQINRLTAKLKKGEDVPQSDIDQATTTPAGIH